MVSRMSDSRTPLSTILAEVQVAGAMSEPDGERITQCEIGDMQRWLLEDAPFPGSRRLGFAIRQLLSDRARLAAEVERLRAELRKRPRVLTRDEYIDLVGR
jgi:hypothetical protein